MSFNPSNRPGRAAVAGENGASADTTGVSPTVTHYQQMADQVSAMIDQIVPALPRLEPPHPTTVRFVRGNANLPIPFLENALAAVGRSEELQVISRLDVSAGWDTLQLNQVIQSLIDKLYHFAKKLAYTRDTRLALLGADCRQLYYLVKGLARDPERADMLELVAVLKRDLGPRGKKKAKSTVRKPGPALLPETEPETALMVLAEPPAANKRVKRPTGKEAPAVTSI